MSYSDHRRSGRGNVLVIATLALVWVLGLTHVAAVAEQDQPGDAAPASIQASELTIASVAATDTKTIEVRFGSPLSARTIELITGNAAYLTHYVRISGGTAGESDGVLDGRSLNTISGTNAYVIDDGDRTGVRLVLGASATLRAVNYQFVLDGNGHLLGDDLLIEGADGSQIPGTSTEPRTFAGSAVPAALATIAEIDSLDTRTLRLQFDGPVLGGMPAGDYTGTGLGAVTGEAPTVRPRYVQAIPGTDQTEWILTFGADLVGGAPYTFTLTASQHRLRTTAGQLATDSTLTGSFTASSTAYTATGVADVTIDDDRSTLTVTFDRRIASVNAGGTTQPIIETPNGISGVTLSRQQVLDLVDLDAFVHRTPGNVARAELVPIEDALADVAGYFPDRSTFVIRLDGGLVYRRASSGTIAFDAGRFLDVAGQPIATAPAHTFAVPNNDVEQITTDYDRHAQDYLTVDRDASVVFPHYGFSFTNAANGDYSVRPNLGGVDNEIVNEEIPAIVVENKYIEATFVPEYGGRLLSLVYKPTGHDLLYTNPVGTPYGFTSNNPGSRGNSPFYWNWLMVWGGVFPTVTEPEHGKYWFLPWDYTIEETRHAVVITMSNKDTAHYSDRPGNFNKGATGIETTVVWTVTKDRPTVDMNVTVHNPGDVARNYEYWTCTTFAPGINGTGSPTMQVVSPAEVVRHVNWSPWMRDVEQRAPGRPADYLLLDKLNHMYYWQTGGIAYGQDLDILPQADWWGVVNQENGEGVIRVGDNKITPGMKFWKWGHQASFDTSIYSPGQSARPYIELWAGTSDEFFINDRLEPGESKTWTETYLPTMDLGNVTNANANGAAYVQFEETGDGSVAVKADVFSTLVEGKLTAELVDTATGDVLASSTFRGHPVEAETLRSTAPSGATVELVLSDRDSGEVLLTAWATHS